MKLESAIFLLALPASISCFYRNKDDEMIFGRGRHEMGRQEMRRQEAHELSTMRAPRALEEEGSMAIDLDKDIGPVRVVTDLMYGIRESVSPLANDASLVTRLTVLTANAMFDAIAPYHPTAVGIYSSLGRRPAHERTYRNKNIAAFYCVLRVVSNSIPEQEKRFSRILHDAGLDPHDDHESTTDPIGIGNICGRKINKFRDHDGMNSKGDICEKKHACDYNRKPYRDYTGYKPVNPHYEIVDPTRWQPAVHDHSGIFNIQKFVTPHHGLTKPYSISDAVVRNLKAKPHGRLMKGQDGMELYRNTTDQVLAASAALTDEQKMAVEFFDDKVEAVYFAFFETHEAKNMTLDEFVFVELATNIAAFDTSIVVWREKRRWDAARPFTAVRHLYGDSRLTAYGGKGRGTVDDIRGDEWQSYIPVADHPEYPSITAGVCAAHAEATTIWFGEIDSHLRPVHFDSGSSKMEPGVTPARRMSLSWPTWTKYKEDCARSRFWGGLHFADAIEEGSRIGTLIARHSVEFVRRHVNPHSSSAN